MLNESHTTISSLLNNEYSATQQDSLAIDLLRRIHYVNCSISKREDTSLWDCSQTRSGL